MSKKQHGDRGTQAVLDALETPAKTIRQLQQQNVEVRAELMETERKLAASEEENERLRRQLAHMKGELYRAGPVSEVDEPLLAKRHATITYAPHPRRGVPIVTLTMLHARPVRAASLLDAIDLALKRPPVRRGTQS